MRPFSQRLELFAGDAECLMSLSVGLQPPSSSLHSSAGLSASAQGLPSIQQEFQTCSWVVEFGWIWNQNSYQDKRETLNIFKLRTGMVCCWGRLSTLTVDERNLCVFDIRCKRLQPIDAFGGQILPDTQGVHLFVLYSWIVFLLWFISSRTHEKWRQKWSKMHLMDQIRMKVIGEQVDQFVKID